MELERPFKTNVFTLVPYPGTEILKIYEEKGLTPNLSPYTGGAIEMRASEDDWYKQMALLAGYVKKEQYEHLYKNRNDIKTRKECYDIYMDNINKIALKEKWVISPDNDGSE